MRTAPLLLALAACGSDGGTSAPPDVNPTAPDAAPRETVTENVPLLVNEVREAILVGGAGDIARLRLGASTPSIDWNIHAHPSSGLVVVQEGFRQMTVDYTFAPDKQADWYLLVRNKGLTDINMQLEIELYGNITWSGWQ